MSSYVAPLKDMRFVLNELAGLGEVAKLPGYADATPDTAGAILDEAAKFATEVLDPLNQSGEFLHAKQHVFDRGAVAHVCLQIEQRRDNLRCAP